MHDRESQKEEVSSLTSLETWQNSGSLAIRQVPCPVCVHRLDERDVAAKGILKYVVASADFPGLFARRQLGAVPGGSEESTDTRTGGTQPFSKVALWHQFQFDLPCAEGRVEMP